MTTPPPNVLEAWKSAANVSLAAPGVDTLESDSVLGWYHRVLPDRVRCFGDLLGRRRA